MKKKKPDWISQKDWDAVDVPEWTEEMFRTARPAREIFADIDKFPKPVDRPQKPAAKVRLNIRRGPEKEHKRAKR